ncbi:N-6 DNA methylase [Natronosalvus rutilus]|uniref:N-6 DNA methylase n=1 Tax=Natronosalvus rutilus TaxID=2953753 RepID=A0A9E7N7R5_9EURY|nr:N-6 DNA methylase [Natronosalvus rutilus]UTF53264.1 N-6 DNA methylase [Natronosalvus rutilus]
MSEADIHFEFYRHLANAVSDDPHRNGLTFGDIRPEYGEDIDGFADIVLFESNGSPAMVIEAKAPDGSSRPRNDIDPYAPKVIRQAFRYAGDIGAPYFATFNGSRLVIYDAYEEGVPLLQRSTKSYEIGSLEKFADTFLDEIGRIRAGNAQWDADDDAFVERMKSLHEKISPKLESELKQHLDEDEDFRARFEYWTDTQGIDYEDADEDDQAKVRAEFADQAAYLLINKILFYKILEDSLTYRDEIESMAVSPFRVKEDLEEYFDHVVTEVDFEAIFDHDEIYSEIPLDSVASRVRDFVIELDDQNLSQFDSDVIGRIYEGVIPADRRHEMGEYYTPPAICDLITRLCIDDGSDEVMDPACGSGGFLVSAYNRKKELLPEQKGGHEQILSQIHGVDINRFPAHLSAINLSIQDLTSHTETVNVEVSDFFNINPNTLRFGRVKAGAGGSEWESGDVENAIGGMDAVVGNPPYIRYQNIGDKENVRSHLSGLDADYLSGFSDIYSYFITHATEFLKDGGKLGFITSDRWLSSQYGEDLQQFLLDHYKINAVIKFTSQTFDDALIGATVVIVEKCEDEWERDDNRVKFIKVKERMDLDDLAEEVEQEFDSDKLIISDEYRLLATSQVALRENAKWSLYYNAPPAYFELLHGEGICELQDVADLHLGKKVGGNTYFYHRMGEWKELGLDEYASPAIKASGQITKIRFDDEAAKEWGVLNVRDLVEEALDDGPEFGDTALEHVKGWLEDNGHDTLLEYVEKGEEEGHQHHDRCKRREVWFDIEDIKQYRPPVAMAEFLWTQHRAVWNEANAFVDYQFHCIKPDDDVSDKLLTGILNSKLAWMTRELEGREASGQSMTRSRMARYEAEQMSIVDPRKVSDGEAERIVEAFEALMQAEDEAEDPDESDAVKEARNELDKAVLNVIDAEDRFDEVKQAVTALVENRREGAGEQTEVLVDRAEEKEVIELEGVVEARESTRLTDFTG